jgi:hypothetical protein
VPGSGGGTSWWISTTRQAAEIQRESHPVHPERSGRAVFVDEQHPGVLGKPFPAGQALDAVSLCGGHLRPEHGPADGDGDDVQPTRNCRRCWRHRFFRRRHGWSRSRCRRWQGRRRGYRHWNRRGFRRGARRDGKCR